jgi:hypothetical protein
MIASAALKDTMKQTSPQTFIRTSLLPIVGLLAFSISRPAGGALALGSATRLSPGENCHLSLSHAIEDSQQESDSVASITSIPSDLPGYAEAFDAADPDAFKELCLRVPEQIFPAILNDLVRSRLRDDTENKAPLEAIEFAERAQWAARIASDAWNNEAIHVYAVQFTEWSDDDWEAIQGAWLHFDKLTQPGFIAEQPLEALTTARIGRKSAVVRGDSWGIGLGLYAEAEALAHTDNHLAALYCYSHAQRAFERFQQGRRKLECLGKIASQAAAMAYWGEAIDALEQAHDEARRLNDDEARKTIDSRLREARRELRDSRQSGDEQPPLQILDPYTGGQPSVERALGVHGIDMLQLSLLEGPRTDANIQPPDLVQQLGAILRCVETEHFLIVSSLSAYNISTDDQERSQIRAELKALKTELRRAGGPSARIKTSTSTIDPWLRLHLFGRRCEKEFELMHKAFGVATPTDQKRLPTSPSRRKHLIFLGSREQIGLLNPWVGPDRDSAPHRHYGLAWGGLSAGAIYPDQVSYGVERGHISTENVARLLASYPSEMELFDSAIPLIYNCFLEWCFCDGRQRRRGAGRLSPSVEVLFNSKDWLSSGLIDHFRFQLDPRWPQGGPATSDTPTENLQARYDWPKALKAWTNEEKVSTLRALIESGDFWTQDDGDLDPLAWSRATFLLENRADDLVSWFRHFASEQFQDKLNRDLAGLDWRSADASTERNNYIAAAFYDFIGEDPYALDKEWIRWARKYHR